MTPEILTLDGHRLRVVDESLVTAWADAVLDGKVVVRAGYEFSYTATWTQPG